MGNCQLCEQEPWHSPPVLDPPPNLIQPIQTLRRSRTFVNIFEALQKAYDTIPEPQPTERPLAEQKSPLSLPSKTIAENQFLRSPEDVKKEVSQSKPVENPSFGRVPPVPPPSRARIQINPKPQELSQTFQQISIRPAPQNLVQITLVFGERSEYSYTGQMANNLYEGEGILTSPEGFYKGTFHEGKKSGKGIFRWKIGRRYIGEYKNDLKEGYGEIYNTDGTLSYKGEWKNDLPNGQGTGYINRQQYIGIWINGQIKTKRKRRSNENSQKSQSTTKNFKSFLEK